MVGGRQQHQLVDRALVDHTVLLAPGRLGSGLCPQRLLGSAGHTRRREEPYPRRAEPPSVFVHGQTDQTGRSDIGCRHALDLADLGNNRDRGPHLGELL
jgi:hypothetical protein